MDDHAELLTLLHINLHELQNSCNFRIVEFMELLIAIWRNHRIAKLQNCILPRIQNCLHCYISICMNCRIDEIATYQFAWLAELMKLPHINLHDLQNSCNFRIAEFMELLIAIWRNHRIAKLQNCIWIDNVELLAFQHCAIDTISDLQNWLNGHITISMNSE